MSTPLDLCLSGARKIKLGALWIFEHRTKVIGTVGMGFGYAYEHQDQLGTFVPVKRMALTLGVIGAVTFAIGLYNTFMVKRATQL